MHVRADGRSAGRFVPVAVMPSPRLQDDPARRAQIRLALSMYLADDEQIRQSDEQSLTDQATTGFAEAVTRLGEPAASLPGVTA